MTTNPPPPGSGQPDDDPFHKPPPTGGGSPYDSPQGAAGPPSDPYGGTPPPPPPDGGGFGASPPPGSGSPYGGGGNPYNTPPPGGGGGDPYGGGGGGYGGPDPLQGMPPLADMGRRIGAFFIDLLLIGIPLTLIQLPFRRVETETDDFGDVISQSYGGSGLFWTLVSCAAYVAYEWLMVRANGQTVGKKLMKLRVAMLKDGSTPDSSTALLRASVLWLPALLCCYCVWWFILVLSAAADKPYRQALHDKAAKTVVVSTP
ncbi:RDD family protein [Streptomyces sp. KLOTTS4A1]|uniref:RDD family protein n=1 Tax=Streptomyces sp. KLOTTS4A1 TaxID=3390996 RepID=UPI0039F58391